jgi:hypothetical protein
MATTVKVEGDDVMQVRIVAAGVVVGLEESGFKNVQTLIELAPDDVAVWMHQPRYWRACERARLNCSTSR